MAKNLNILILCTMCLLFYGCSTSDSIPKSKYNDQTLKQKASQIIIELLDDDDTMIKVNAIEVAASSREQVFLPKIESLLRNEYVPVRFAAAIAVGDMQYKRAKPKLYFLLQKGDENTKIAAAYALYKFGEKDKITIIQNELLSKDMTVRANAVMLLGKTGNKESLGKLHTAMTATDSDDKVSQQAVLATARLGDEKIINKIWTLIISLYADDRIIGLEALGFLKNPNAKDIIITKFEDEIPGVRIAAASQLGKMGDIQGEPIVLELLQKNPENPQKTQILTLLALAVGDIGTEKLQQYLPKLLENQSKIVKLAAAKSFFALNDN